VSVVPVSVPCFQHADRTGFAVCMACRAVLCQECATTFDGINYCRPCLDRQRGVVRTASAWPRRLGHAATAAIQAGLAVACVHLMAWVASVLAGLR
jgi:hypothetical protein